MQKNDWRMESYIGIALGAFFMLLIFVCYFMQTQTCARNVTDLLQK